MAPEDSARDGITRRSFLAGAAALGAGSSFLKALDRAMPLSSPPWPGYDEATVIDCLASPGYFNYPENPPLNEEMLAHAALSGITAVNLTVGTSTFEGSVQNIARWMREVERYPGALTQIRTAPDLLEAKKTHRLGLIFGFQDTTPFEGELEPIGTFRDLGVRIVQLTYNNRNLVGDGCLEPSNGGLSRYGHSVVERLNELGILVDLSHCSQNTTAEAIQISSRPVAVTHSGCNAVARHPRGKDDAELRALAERGGVMGIYLMPFLTPGRPATAADVLDHLEHAIQVCGEDHVGIGSDLSIAPIDGSEEYWSKHREFVRRRIENDIAAPNEDPDILFTVQDLNSPRRMDLLADGLSARGHSHGRIEKVLGANWLRLFREVWGE
jgi:membrane dipeptidase